MRQHGAVKIPIELISDNHLPVTANNSMKHTQKLQKADEKQ